MLTYLAMLLALGASFFGTVDCGPGARPDRPCGRAVVLFAVATGPAPDESAAAVVAPDIDTRASTLNSAVLRRADTLLAK